MNTIADSRRRLLMWRTRGWLVAPVVLSVAAAVFGLHDIGQKSLWDDEGFSVATAHLSFTHIVKFTIQRDPHTGLYHLLLHLWIKLRGDGQAWVRSLSVVFGVATVPVLWSTVRRLFGSVVAVVSIFLLVCNGFFVAYEQEGRPYTLVLLLCVFAMWCFVNAVQKQQQSWWLAWGAAGAFSAYGHPFAVGVVAAQAFSLLVLPVDKRPLRRVLQAAGAFVVVIAPLTVLLVLRRKSHIDWIPKLTLQTLTGPLHLLTGNGNLVETALVSALVAWVFLFGFRQLLNNANNPDTWPVVLAVLWAGLIPVAATLVSVFHPVLVDRYLMPALPGVVTATAFAVVRLCDRHSAVVTAAVLAAFSLFSVNSWYSSNTKDNWRDAAAYVSQHAQPGDGIIFTIDHRMVFDYYFDHWHATTLPPQPISPQRPWGSPIVAHENRPDLTTPPAVERAVAGYQRVWVMYLDFDGLPQPLLAGLQQQFGDSQRITFSPRVTARLYGGY